MSYELALNKAWAELEKLSSDKRLSVKFLNDEYDIDVENKRILSTSCNIPAKEVTTVLILHYLKKQLEGLPELTNEWISFKELPESIGYYLTFKKRIFKPILRKYGSHPEAILENVERLGAKRVQQADFSIVIETFPQMPVLVALWRGDEEFGPEVSVLFDKNFLKIFCTEDIIVLLELVAHAV